MNTAAKCPPLSPRGEARLSFGAERSKCSSGEHPHTDTVVIRFPDAASAAGWHGSAAYQALIPVREQAVDIVVVCFES